MELRSLGRTGLRVSALSFGAMTFGDTKGFMKGVASAADEARRVLELHRLPPRRVAVGRRPAEPAPLRVGAAAVLARLPRRGARGHPGRARVRAGRARVLDARARLPERQVREGRGGAGGHAARDV